ncbi:MAG: septum formation inhibitor MinC, partial [Methylocystis sp.]|nr:septum formation inhibitor MinC [Methylocystis sp.]
MTQTSAARIRFKGRSFPVFTLEPEAPLDAWIEGLDGLLAQSPAFFARKSIVVDLAKLELTEPQIID